MNQTENQWMGAGTNRFPCPDQKLFRFFLICL